MSNEGWSKQIKVIVVGNGSVGKTSLVARFAYGKYEDSYKKTIGVDFCEKEMYVSSLNQTVKFMLWDTAGQEEFDSMTRRYYRGAAACVLAFSIVDRASFEALESWYEKVSKECGKIATVIMINKLDLIDQAKVTLDEVEQLAKRLNVKCFKTSVKNDQNVKEIFEFLAQHYYDTVVKASADAGQSGDPAASGADGDPFSKPFALNNKSNAKQQKKGCC